LVLWGKDVNELPLFAEKMFRYLRNIAHEGDLKLMPELVVELFDVLFRSGIEAGRNVDQIRQRVSAIFNLDEAKVERPFSA
jgi:hypothetical protein